MISYFSIYKYRFDIFLFTQCMVLFGAILFPQVIYKEVISPFLLITNIIAGLYLLHKRKKVFWFITFILVLAIVSYLIRYLSAQESIIISSVIFFSFFLFHIFVTKELVSQVWKAKIVNGKIIIALISGFVSLGLVGFFMCSTIELYAPNSFSIHHNGIDQIQNLMYFSYVTLLTIGFGDIVPLTIVAQKVSLLIGLIGQLYLVILTGIILGKYINQRQ